MYHKAGFQFKVEKKLFWETGIKIFLFKNFKYITFDFLATTINLQEQTFKNHSYDRIL